MEPEEFEGRIGRYHWESEAWWPPEPRPPEGAPNVLVVVLDDVGYAQLGCFGSDIATPHLDALAAGGLRYAGFHTTALCSPTRACVLTGRNHHNVGMGRIVDLATGFPGYDARIPRSCALLPAMLTPARLRRLRGRQVAPHARGRGAPRRVGATAGRSGRGFERWYGFFPGETHQFVPALIHDSHHVDPPGSVRGRLPPHHRPGGPRHRVDRGPAQRRRRQAVAPLPRHRRLPLAAPRAAPSGSSGTAATSTRAGTRGARPRSPARRRRGCCPSTPSCRRGPTGCRRGTTSSDDRARASTPATWRPSPAYLSHTDHELGRLFDRLRALGELDDTLVMVLSDNGASSEGGPIGSLNDVRVWNALPRTVEEAAERLDEIGGPRIHNNYPWGWTVAGNTPFRRWKRETHEGGVADPLIVHWPDRHRRAGRGAAPVRARHRPAADDPRRHRHRARRPRSAGVAQRPLDGVSIRVHLRRRRRARGPHRAALRDARVPGALPGRVEGGDLPGDPGRRAAPRRGGVGALRPAGRPVGVPRPGRRRARAARRP